VAHPHVRSWKLTVGSVSRSFLCAGAAGGAKPIARKAVAYGASGDGIVKPKCAIDKREEEKLCGPRPREGAGNGAWKGLKKTWMMLLQQADPLWIKWRNHPWPSPRK